MATCPHIFIYIMAVFAIDVMCCKSRCPSADEKVKKMWYSYKMEFYLPRKKTKRCHL